MISNKALLYTERLLTRLASSKMKPLILSYLITDRCNSHCITCDIWRSNRDEELSSDDLRNLLSDKLFSQVQHVGISGGEPSIFFELKEHLQILIDSLPSLQGLSITTNCINADFWFNHVESIYNLCARHGIFFQLNTSLDGIGEIHDKVRGTSGNFASFDKVNKFLCSKNIPYQIHTTIDKYNVYHVNAILNYACLRNADIIFRLASRIHRLKNEQLIEKISLNEKQTSFFCDFLISKRLLDYTKSPGRRLFYRSLRHQLLNKSERKAPCYFKDSGIVISSDGKMSHCSRFRQFFAEIHHDDRSLLTKFLDKNLNEAYCSNICSECYHDQTGFWSPKAVIAEILRSKLDLIRKFFEVFYNVSNALLLGIKKKKKETVHSAVVVGMYGGEHVGDAAILGGVIYRLQRRYPQLKVVSVFSFRRDRTKCWIENLTELEGIEIGIYEKKEDFIKQMNESNLLVWGGGPIMDIPVIMSRNYYFIRKALSIGLCTEMEGIGYGPVRSIFGRFISKHILKSADRVTARSIEDVDNVSMICDVDRSISRDPAFDYLALIPKIINISRESQESIDKILERKVGQKILALNIRPLWSRYGKSGSFNNDTFLLELVKVLQSFMARGYLIVFFPMNADQFGFSDLEVAYELQELLNASTGFRVFETEPTINELIYLLRQVDLSICMRFHAAIFSLSQGIKTIGLDYDLNGKGKISHLFENLQNNLFVNIVDFNAESLMSKYDAIKMNVEVINHV